MPSLTEHEVCQLLQDVNAAQDSIQRTSKWIMQNKQDIEVITLAWFKTYKEGADALRTALIYVFNDTVQLAKHEKDRTVPIAFHPHVVNSISLASEKVKKPIRRCLEVFRERFIYPKHVIDEMQSALDGITETDAAADSDDPSNLDLEQYCRWVENYSEACAAIDRARKILDSINFELKDEDTRIKHKNGVVQLENEVNQMIEKLHQFIANIEAQCKRTTKITQLNEKAVAYFENQLHDVNVVYDAYERFAKGIELSRAACEQIVGTGILPGQSPPDAPSPTTSEEHAELHEDMEIDDEDMPAGSHTSLIAPKDYIPFPMHNLPPNSHQPAYGNHAATSRADPRKSRAEVANPSVNAFPPVPSLPPALATMLPVHQRPPYAPRPPASVPADVPYSPTSVVMQTNNGNSQTSGPDTDARSSSGNTSRTPSFDSQQPFAFINPPPTFNIPPPEFPPPSGPQNPPPFFSTHQSPRPRYQARAESRFFASPRSERPRFEGNRPPPPRNTGPPYRRDDRHSDDYRRDDRQSDRRRSSDYERDDWQRKRSRDSR